MCQCELLPKLYSTVQGKNPLSLSEGKSKATCAFPVYLSSSSSLYSVTQIHRLSLPPSLPPSLPFSFGKSNLFCCRRLSALFIWEKTERERCEDGLNEKNPTKRTFFKG